MLWSLIKILLFVVIVAVLALAAGRLLEAEGGVQITAAGTEITLGPLQAVIAIAVLVLALWVVLKLLSLLRATWHFINGDETALSRYFDRNRERKGYQALSEGMLALASGEGRTAMNKAARAEKYLNRPALTNLLTAQAAEVAGDHRKAEAVYRELVKDERTRFVGVRGLMRQKLEAGDTETALQLAQRAFALKPKHGEVQDTLLRLQAEREDWAGARQTLNAKLKYGSLPRDVHKRRDAVLALSEARELLSKGQTEAAREAAIEANRLSPSLVPAATLAARALIAQGKPRPAARVLKKAWEAQPHPELASAFAEIAPDESAEARLKRFRTLLTIDPEHRESRLLEAELHLAGEDFPAARRALGDLAERSPDARICAIMAAIERGEGGSDAVVRGWLTRALTAPRGPQWVCTNCHAIHNEWAPVCDNCAAFDTMSWQAPPSGDIALPGGAEMLPLLIGQGDAAAEAREAPDAAKADGAQPPGKARDAADGTESPGVIGAPTPPDAHEATESTRSDPEALSRIAMAAGEVEESSETRRK